MYAKMTIQQLEQEARGFLAKSKSSIIEAAKILRYLQKTSRFKENERYRKEQFKIYLEDQFGVRYGTYQEWVRALPFEKEAESFGVGLVAKTLKRCGVAGTRRAFAEINALEDVKKKTIPKEKIEAVIEKHQDPRRAAAIRKEYNDWQAMYKAEAAAHETTKKKLADAANRIVELEEQVERLKMTASIVPQIRKIVEAGPARNMATKGGATNVLTA